MEKIASTLEHSIRGVIIVSFTTGQVCLPDTLFLANPINFSIFAPCFYNCGTFLTPIDLIT